jgi:hypothetical protein
MCTTLLTNIGTAWVEQGRASSLIHRRVTPQTLLSTLEFRYQQMSFLKFAEIWLKSLVKKLFPISTPLIVIVSI